MEDVLRRYEIQNIQEKEMTEYGPGWIAPGNKYMLADPVELGYVPARPPIDWKYIQNLGHIAGNPYEEAT
jgi:hypothetical protein